MKKSNEGVGGSFARVNVDRFDASFAFDVTAPVKFALATLFDGGFVSVVAPTAAHQIASVHSGRCSIARPSVRTYTE